MFIIEYNCSNKLIIEIKHKMRSSQCPEEGCEKYFSHCKMKKHIMMDHTNSIDLPMHDYQDKICDYFQQVRGCKYFEKYGKECKWKHICKICKAADHGEYQCFKKLCKHFNESKGCNYFEKYGKKCMWKHECSMCNKEGHSVQWCPVTACES